MGGYRKKLTHSFSRESHRCNHTKQLGKQRQASRKRKQVLSLCRGWMLPRGRDTPRPLHVSHRGRPHTKSAGEHLVLGDGLFTSGQTATIKNKMVSWIGQLVDRLMTNFPPLQSKDS